MPVNLNLGIVISTPNHAIKGRVNAIKMGLNGVRMDLVALA